MSLNNLSVKQAKLAHFAYISFLCLWSLGNLFLLAKKYVMHTLLVSHAAGNVYINDFLHFYCAGQLVLSGQGTLAYDPQMQLQLLDRCIYPFHTAQVFYTQYVPFCFPLSVPLAVFPADISFFVWATCSCIFMGLSLFALWKFLPRPGKPWQVFYLFLGLFSTLANLACLELGQLGNFLSAITCAYLIALAANKESTHKFKLDILGGICLALTSLKPQYALFLIIPAICFKKWRLLAAAVIMELALLTLSGITIGWQNVITYPGIVLSADQNPLYAGVHPEHMVSIRGLLSSLLPDPVSLKISLAFWLVCAAILFHAWIKVKKTSLSDWKNLFAATIMSMLVFSPHTNIYDCVLLIIPAYLLLPSLNWQDLNNLRTPAEKWLCLLLWLYPIWSALWFVLWEYLPGVSQNPIPFFCYHLFILILLCCRKAETEKLRL